MESDRNKEYMRAMWGTDCLVTDYHALDNRKVLREIVHDDYEEPNSRLKKQNELHSRFRNDLDYDDWDYGTEPLFESATK